MRTPSDLPGFERPELMSISSPLVVSPQWDGDALLPRSNVFSLHQKENGPRKPRPSSKATVRTAPGQTRQALRDRKSTRLNSSHSQISYAVFCLKKKKTGC